MRFVVGPVPPACAAAWTDWELKAIGALRAEGAETGPLCSDALDTIESYVRAWARATRGRGGVFRWQSDVHPDHVEYLANALCNLDAHLSSQVATGRRRAAPAKADVFRDVLVDSLLRALSAESGSRAAFSEQLGHTWSTLRPAT